MELTIFSDLHGYLNNLQNLQNHKNLFFLGDIYTNKEFVELIGKDFLNYYLNKINSEQLFSKFEIVKENLSLIKINNETPSFFKENNIYILPGNHETIDEYNDLKKLPNLHDLHLQKKVIDDIEFIGHGGMISPDKRMNLENCFIYSDEQVAKNLIDLNPSKNCIILMHELPIGDYCIKTREIIEKIKPLLVIGGHNHQISKQKFVINGVPYLASGMKGDFIKLKI